MTCVSFADRRNIIHLSEEEFGSRLNGRRIWRPLSCEKPAGVDPGMLPIIVCGGKLYIGMPSSMSYLDLSEFEEEEGYIRWHNAVMSAEIVFSTNTSIGIVVYAFRESQVAMALFDIYEETKRSVFEFSQRSSVVPIKIRNPAIDGKEDVWGFLYKVGDGTKLEFSSDRVVTFGKGCAFFPTKDVICNLLVCGSIVTVELKVENKKVSVVEVISECPKSMVPKCVAFCESQPWRYVIKNSICVVVDLLSDGGLVLKDDSVR